MLLIPNLKVFLFCYSLVMIPVLFLAFKFREKFWKLYGSVFFPLVLTALIINNLVSFPSQNRVYFPPSYRSYLNLLPSNRLVDIFENSMSKFRSIWKYDLIEIYYQGLTLHVPDNMIESLDLSPELFITQGQLAEVILIEQDRSLTERDIETILELEHVDIDMNDGYTYYLVTAELDSGTSLYLLRSDNQLFFVPESYLQENEGEP